MRIRMLTTMTRNRGRPGSADERFEAGNVLTVGEHIDAETAELFLRCRKAVEEPDPLPEPTPEIVKDTDAALRPTTEDCSSQSDRRQRVPRYRARSRRRVTDTPD